MTEHQSMIETTARHQIAERVATASTQRLSTYLPAARRHRLGRRPRGDRLES